MQKEQRFELVLTRGNQVVNTFTWAETRKGAATRVAQSFEDNPEVWEGWNFEVK